MPSLRRKDHKRRKKSKTARRRRQSRRTGDSIEITTSIEIATEAPAKHPVQPHKPRIPVAGPAEIVDLTIDSLPKSPVEAPTQPPDNRTTYEAYLESQSAPKKRVPWSWLLRGKCTETYMPVMRGKWWSYTKAELAVESVTRQSNLSHIARIMETELGQQLYGDNRCRRCKESDHECWVYADAARQQISRPGSACTRCRWSPAAGGCSLSTRTPNVSLTKRLHNEPILFYPRPILPKSNT
ncbi:hypothetical protein BDV25DRAFT_154843 [Aspergillus avenaceus]|uniref:Uncharacterized protein n=1 Tax=Aspergillus avenaceus TaxID=36643 RepID=A0A5N6TV34_ASPAV|nr:hypothetical protein BDV25DRAFT_154843 [Aspergillus avenaceus]